MVNKMVLVLLFLVKLNIEPDACLPSICYIVILYLVQIWSTAEKDIIHYFLYKLQNGRRLFSEICTQYIIISKFITQVFKCMENKSRLIPSLKLYCCGKFCGVTTVFPCLQNSWEYIFQLTLCINQTYVKGLALDVMQPYPVDSSKF